VYFFKEHDWNFNIPRPFRSEISIFLRKRGQIYILVWAEQVAFYLALSKFIALVDRNSLQGSAYVGHDEFHGMNLQHIR
jgi:hypothetical protein